MKIPQATDSAVEQGAQLAPPQDLQDLAPAVEPGDGHAEARAPASSKTWPSRMRTTRWARAATVGSWVTDHQGQPGAVGLLEQLHDLLRGGGVERPGGLVGQQQPGLGDEGPGDGHPLLLAARHLGGDVLGPGRQAHPVQRLEGLRPPAAAGTAAVLQRQLDVLGPRS
jgi:hypothetical protein